MFESLFQSKGVKRTLSVFLFLAGQAATVIPALAPYAGMINHVASLLGAVGIVHAAAAGTLTDSK